MQQENEQIMASHNHVNESHKYNVEQKKLGTHKRTLLFYYM